MRTLSKTKHVITHTCRFVRPPTHPNHPSWASTSYLELRRHGPQVPCLGQDTTRSHRHHLARRNLQPNTKTRAPPRISALWQRPLGFQAVLHRKRDARMHRGVNRVREARRDRDRLVTLIRAAQVEVVLGEHQQLGTCGTKAAAVGHSGSRGGKKAPLAWRSVSVRHSFSMRARSCSMASTGESVLAGFSTNEA